MDLEKSGKLIYNLRKSKNMTQKQLADKLGICAKTISKWETGHGFPDVAYVTELADIFGVSAETLLNGKLNQNKEENGNMKNIKFHICDKCGNFSFQTGNGDVICCGKKTNVLQMQTLDDEHTPAIEAVEDELYITFNHSMTKNHYISYIIGMRYDSILITRLYPEQNAEARIPRAYGGKIYCYCNQHGLYKIK